MNRRIVELETEAYNYVNSLLSPDDYPEDTYRWHHRVMFNKKFAELIVLECARWLGNREFASPEALKQHFGVEE